MQNNFTITKENYNHLIKDLNDYKNGIKSKYLIDTFDIVLYIFPFLSNRGYEEYRNLELNLLNKYLIAYKYFYENEDCFFPNFYNHEYDKIINYISNAVNHRNVNSLINKISSEKYNEEFIFKNLGVLLSLYCGINEKETIGRYKWIDSKLKQFKGIDENSLSEKLIKSVFLSYKSEYIDHIRFNSKRAEIDEINKAKNDILLIANMYFLNKNNSEKNLEIYKVLSSTDHKTNNIVEVFKRHIINDEHVFIQHRKIENYDLFLKFRSAKLSDIEPLIYDISQNTSALQSKGSSNINKITFMLDYEDDIIDNHLVIDDDIINFFNTLVVKKELDLNLFDQIKKVLLKINDKESFKLNSLRLYNYKFKGYIIPFSQDAVKSYTQSLPILLFSNTSLFSDKKYLDWIIDLIDPKDYSEKSMLPFKKSKLNLGKYLMNSVDIDYDKDLLNYFFSLVLLGSTSKVNDEFISKHEVRIFEKFENQYFYSFNLDIKTDSNKNIDIIYLRLFLLRRSLKFNEANEFIKKIDSIRTKNIKVSHAIGLVYYSWYYHMILGDIPKYSKGAIDNVKKDFIFELSNKSLSSLNNTKELIIRVLENRLETSLEKLYERILIAIDNTICDIHTQQYWFGLNKDLFKRIDNNISKIKHIFVKTVREKLSKDYKINSAFLHTEFDIELCELDLLIKEGRNEVAFNLIQNMNKLLPDIKNNPMLRSHVYLYKFSLVKFDELNLKLNDKINN